jgi:hypothetical protein
VGRSLILHQAPSHIIASLRSFFNMSRNTFEASAQSVCFSGAIDFELTHETEEEASTFPVAVTFNAYPEAFDDTLSVAIAFEIETTYKKAAMSIIDVEDKCMRFAATLSDDEDIKATDHPVTQPVAKGSGGKQVPFSLLNLTP